LSAAYTVERARVLKVFGWQLRTMRERQGLAQEGFAEVANVHRNEIGILERGQCEPGLLMVLIVADALEVPPRVLLDGLPVPRERRPARCSKGEVPGRETFEPDDLLAQAARGVREREARRMGGE
jgi:transcriptional regulator with XRE-family HTH domain